MFFQKRTDHSNVPFKEGQVMAGQHALNTLSLVLEAPLVRSLHTRFEEQLSSLLCL